MNNVFNFKRFTWIFRKTLMERPVQLFGIFALDFILVLMLYAFMRDILGWGPTQNLTFFWGLSFGGCYLSAALFNYFSSNANGSSYLTLPCSALEKWLCAIIIVGVIYTTAFVLFYKGIDTAFVSYYHQHLNPKEANYLSKLESVQLLDMKGHVSKTSFYVYILLASSMLVGSLYFNKLSFVKTGLVVCAVCAVLFVANIAIANLFFDNVGEAFPFFRVTMNVPTTEIVSEAGLMIRPKNDQASILLPQPYHGVVESFIQYGLAIILSITAYLRLKEKEF
jgi:hypothetical protein